MSIEHQIIIGGIKWLVNSARTVEGLCPKHHLRLRLKINNYESCHLECAECEELYSFPREYNEQLEYVLDKIDSKNFKNMRFVNLDDEVIPLAEVQLKESGHFVTGLLTKSKVGLRLVLYAGEKGAQDKTQIFVEPEIKRLAFDQKNLHPTDIFTKVEAVFKDGSSHIIEKSKDNDE